jgi:hypothetical protein
MSIKGTKFTFFTKSPFFKIIPFDYKLRDVYKDHFFVRTWTRPKLAPPVCENYQIRNILMTLDEYMITIWGALFYKDESKKEDLKKLMRKK